MTSLKKMPPEVLVHILQNCHDFADVLAMVSTCKRLHSVWATNPGSVIWFVGKRSIVAFDDALMAVRATHIVKTAFEFGELPPQPFPLHELSGIFSKPGISELHAVLDMRHMMRCLQQQVIYLKREGAWLYHHPDLAYRKDLVGYECEEWEGNFFRSMYRVIIAASLFTRPYTEPFFLSDKENDADFLHRWKYRPTHLEILKGGGYPQITDLDLKHIRRFPVYNLGDGGEKDQNSEAFFRKFAKWVVQDCQTRASRVKGSLGDKGFGNEVYDIIGMIAAYEHLANTIVNADGNSNHDRIALAEADRLIPGRIRKTSVVLFGVFQVEEITMPAKLGDAATTFLVAEQKPESRMLYPDVTEVLRKILEMGNDVQRISYHDDWFAPPGTLQLFAFSLRKYMDLRIPNQKCEQPLGNAWIALAESIAFFAT